MIGCKVEGEHLQGETSGDDLGLLHQPQGFARQPSQSLSIVDQSLEMCGLGVDGSLHRAKSPEHDPSQPHPAQQCQAPWECSQ